MVIGQAALDGRRLRARGHGLRVHGRLDGQRRRREVLARLRLAAERGVPLITVTGSGGARMQEGILSLMQLPKTVCAVEDLHDAGQAMISVMAHPTTGGVLASFATLGDVLLAEPGALMSFAGPRVVQQTTREKLPEDFGLAEQNLRFGHLDAIVPRPELRPTLSQAAEAVRCRRLSTSCVCASGSEAPQHAAARRSEALRRARAAPAPARPHRRRSRPTRRSGVPSSLRATSERPYTLDYVERLFEDWFELHGDRGRADDGAMVAGLGKLDGRTVALIGQQKGRDIQERVDAQLRDAVSGGLQQGDAGRWSSPTATDSRSISLVDTPAPTRVAAEQHGQGGAIAASQAVMARLTVPDHRLRDRRGRLRRRDRDRARRPRADAGERDLLRHLARGLRRDPVARRGRGEEGGGRLQAGRGRTASSWA